MEGIGYIVLSVIVSIPIGFAGLWIFFLLFKKPVIPKGLNEGRLFYQFIRLNHLGVRVNRDDELPKEVRKPFGIIRLGLSSYGVLFRFEKERIDPKNFKEEFYRYQTEIIKNEQFHFQICTNKIWDIENYLDFKFDSVKYRMRIKTDEVSIYISSD